MSYNSLVVAKNSQRAEELLLQRHLHSEKKIFSLSNSLILGIVCQKIKIFSDHKFRQSLNYSCN